MHQKLLRKLFSLLVRASLAVQALNAAVKDCPPSAASFECTAGNGMGAMKQQKPNVTQGCAGHLGHLWLVPMHSTAKTQLSCVITANAEGFEILNVVPLAQL